MIRLPIAVANLPNAGHGLARRFDIVIEETAGSLGYTIEPAAIGTATAAELALAMRFAVRRGMSLDPPDLLLLSHHMQDDLEAMGYDEIAAKREAERDVVIGRAKTPQTL